MINLKGKTVIVTGGTRGIGYSVAEEFAKQGANVVVNYVSASTNVEEVLSGLNAHEGRVVAVQANVAKMDECEKIFAKAEEEFGTVDILINNAGITKDGLFMRMTEEDFDRVLDVNLKGVFNMSKLAIRPMMKQKWGRIINMSSVVALIGNAGQVNYVASKAAVIGMTKSLAKEIGSKGVTVNAVAPGFIETDMTKDLPEEVVNNYMASIPLRKLGQAKDIAYACIYLASDMADYVTGQTLSVNGGMA